MPFASLFWGSLALGTLKAICREGGIEADVFYLNIPFAKLIGRERYTRMSDLIDSEVCFVSELVPGMTPESVWERYSGLMVGHNRESASGNLLGLKDDFLEIAGVYAPALLKDAMERVRWDDYDVVGFTTNYYQTVASLALARRIKDLHPDKRIVFGGAGCSGDMGEELVDVFPMVDVAVSGEADSVIVELVQALSLGSPLPEHPGVFAKPGIFTARPPREEERKTYVDCDLEMLPVPDYTDYFAQVKKEMPDITVKIPIESSRGCWWGQKCQCSFCGLNGLSIRYRTKSAERVLSEIHRQFEHYGATEFIAVDNIFNPLFFKTFLPGLRQLYERYGITFFYEIKSNLTDSEIQSLNQSGVKEVQAGIENLNDHVLKLMKKGTSGLENVRFLRDCASHGLQVHYSLLWGTPGETRNDYISLRRLIPYIQHLPPPKHIVPVALARFSPYFSNPGKYGIRNVRPSPLYPVLFGGMTDNYDSLANIFNFDLDSDNDEGLNIERSSFIDEGQVWRETYSGLSLVYSEFEEMLIIVDIRYGASKVFRLASPAKDIALFCLKGQTDSNIKKAFSDISEDEIEKFLRRMVEKHIVLPWDGGRLVRYLFLPVQVSMERMHRTMDALRSGEECQEKKTVSS